MRYRIRNRINLMVISYSDEVRLHHNDSPGSETHQHSPKRIDGDLESPRHAAKSPSLMASTHQTQNLVKCACAS